MAAAMQLTAVTAHLTQNIAAIPLLWMLPLGVYLLSFILAFEYSRLYSRPIITRLLVVFICALGFELSKTDTSFPIDITIIVFLVECFVACLFCHAETHALRPTDPRQTTLFYLLIAAGGATGTFFIGIACPLLFSANYDLALAFLVTAALALVVLWRQGWAQQLLWTTATIGMLVLAIMLHVAYTRDALFLTRNFYGSLRVKQTYHAPHQDLAANEPENLPINQQAAPTRMFLNGTIQHGTQIFSSALSRTPTTYYATNSGIGLALTLCCNGRPRNIGVIGLGAGTLAAYGQPGDRFRFYELNPAVPPVAQTLFTYLRDSPAQNTIIPGDGRASLAQRASPTIRRPRNRRLLRRRHPPPSPHHPGHRPLPTPPRPRRNPRLPRLQPVRRPRPRNRPPRRQRPPNPHPHRQPRQQRRRSLPSLLGPRHQQPHLPRRPRRHRKTPSP